jgi:signal transduction histidine kinase
MNLVELDILLVEDNQDDMDLALHALRREKLANRIFVVRDGEEALDFLFCRGAFAERSFEHPPKLILLDLKLPKVDGMEVLKQVKSDPRTKTIPVVIMTSSKEERDLVSGYNLGVNSYIQKPVDFDQFRETVKSVGLYWLVINQPPVSENSKIWRGHLMATTNDLAPQPGQLRVLHVEDNELDAELVAQAMQRDGFSASIVVVQAEKDFERELVAHRPDVVLADYNLPQWQGMEALEVLRREGLDAPLILVSGALGDVTAVECIKRGATDYVLKDGLARLPEAIRRALQEKRMLRLRKQAEEDLARKVEELARSNSDLEQFAYVASHDLQEPLRMVAAYTQLLGERYRGKLDENADKYIGYASEGAQRMQTLIQDLLAFSRVGRKDSPSERVDCDAAMAEVMMSMGPAIKESGAAVTYAALPTVWAERSQMTQLFQNLIGNAIKFRGEEAPAISVQVEKADAQWLFSVSDNGIGISPEYAENIFVVFHRLHARTEYPGNGIGLSICKKIVERNGGKIWVEPRPGHGSVFKFTLPFEDPAAKEMRAEEISMPSS